MSPMSTLWYSSGSFVQRDTSLKVDLSMHGQLTQVSFEIAASIQSIKSPVI